MSKRLLAFVLATFLFTWSLRGLTLLETHDVIRLPFDSSLLYFLGTFGPSIMGTIALIRWNRQRVGAILKETFLLRGGRTTAMMTLLLMPAILGGSYLITRFLFGVSYDLEWLNQPEAIPIVLVYILFLGGPLGEEIGWRGFALPELMKRWSPFQASLLLGVIWSAWHIPSFFIPGSTQDGIPFLLYLVYTMILTMILTVLYLRSKTIGNAVYFHTSSNAALGVFFIIQEPIALVFIGIGMLGALGILLYQERDRMFQRPSIKKDRP